MKYLIAILFWVATTIFSGAETVRVAVAANFTQTAKEIGRAFEKNTKHSALFSFGSTGLLYTQISQQAPFHIFLAADQDRPQMAIEAGLAAPESRFTYAKGKIVLYSKDPNLIKDKQSLIQNNIRKIAIANPATAPYGKAAIEVMERLGVHNIISDKLVLGNNIAQTYQFVQTENAEIGFISLSQVISHNEGARWIIPDHLYTEVAQDAVILKLGATNTAAHSFLNFLKGPIAKEIIEKYGYGYDG